MILIRTRDFPGAAFVIIKGVKSTPCVGETDAFKCKMQNDGR